MTLTKTTKNICFRFVNDNLTSNKDNKTKWKIGKWNKQDGELKCCNNGLHASLTPLESLNNIYGDRWFIAEYRGKIVKEGNKFCASEMRLIKEIPIIVIKRFALFCAKDCLKNYEKEYPNDKRVSECIRITGLYLDGKATLDDLSAAKSAWSAAWSAESAAESAAWSAESAAESAAWSAAKSAAWSAAKSAAKSAAWSAAKSAAKSAAWSAAKSAAWSAAKSAAKSAAWSAAGERQNKELMRLIKEISEEKQDENS